MLYGIASYVRAYMCSCTQLHNTMLPNLTLIDVQSSTALHISNKIHELLLITWFSKLVKSKPFTIYTL